MEPIIKKNMKARVNVACPRCGMDLKKAPQGGFVEFGDTYCCRGCAEGTGCTCYAGTEVKKSFSRPGDIGQRNPENTRRDKNFNAEQSPSSKTIGNRAHATVRKHKSRDQRQWDPPSKRLKTQNKPRDSSRLPARGQSEQRGKLSKRVGGRVAGDRVARTGTKGK